MTWWSPRSALPLVIGAALACGPERAPAPPADRTTDAVEREAYLHDRSFRRQTLVASLVSHENHYSRRRLASYALERGGWDALPEWIPKVAPARGSEVSADAFEAIWDGETPSSESEWLALGERVFFDLPLRAEPPAAYLLGHPELAREVGLGPDADGVWAGMVHFVDERGEPQVGITCALCHAALDEGAWQVGRARRELDYGAMRLHWYEGTGRPLDPELAERMANWGPGRADITDDMQIDPVAIPDLWRVGELDYLTQAATLKQVNTTALAIRQETQFLFANGQRVRPPRELMWALAVYVRSLDAPARTLSGSSAQRERGATVFDAECAGCHSSSTRSGPPMDADLVGTDPALATGPARGTGLYRPSPLIDLAAAAPYLHDGSVDSLESLLEPTRLQTTPGHAFGTQLSAEARQDLLVFLRGL